MGLQVAKYQPLHLNSLYSTTQQSVWENEQPQLEEFAGQILALKETPLITLEAHTSKKNKNVFYYNGIMIHMTQWKGWLRGL